jgi:hypothetical protein
MKIQSLASPSLQPPYPANTSSEKGELIVTCQPGGFEKFFDDLGKIPEAQLSEATIKQVNDEVWNGIPPTAPIRLRAGPALIETSNRPKPKSPSQ